MNFRSLLTSLRFRLMVFALLVTFPAFIIIVFSGLAHHENQAANEQAEMLRMAREIAHEQNLLIQKTRALLFALARVPHIHAGDIAGCNAMLADMLEELSTHAFLGVATPEGDLVCSAPRPADPVSVADRDYFQAALETRDFAMGSYQIGRVSSQPVIALGLPVLDDGDHIQAVLIASLDLTWLDQRRDHTLLPANAAVAVFDQTGVLLYRQPDFETWRGQVLNDETETVQSIVVQQGEGTAELTGLDGVARLYAYTPLRIATDTINGYVAVSIPNEEALARVNQLWVRFFSGLGTTALLVMLLAWFGGDLLIGQRVKRLLLATQRLKRGDLSARAKLEGNGDQLGQLGQAFDDMADALQHHEREREAAKAPLRQYAARMQALVGIGNRLNATLDMEEIAQTVCQETVRAFQVEAVSLSLYDPEGERYYHAADVGLPADYAARVRAVPSSQIKNRLQETRERAGTVVEEGIIIRYDVQAEPGSPNAELYAELGIRTIVSVNLSHGTTEIGRLNLHTIGEPREFDRDDLALLRGLANQAGQSLANARLYAEAQNRLGRLQALRAIDTAILTPQDLVTTLDVIIRQVADHLGVDAAAVLLLDPETQQLNYATGTGFRHAGIQHSALRVGEGVVGRAAQERTLEHIPDLTQTNEFSRAPLIEGEDFVSYFAVPLVAHDRVLGALDIFQRELAIPQPEWIAFLEAVGLQTAIAIDHARLFADTRRLLQQARQQAWQIENVLNTVPEGILFLDREHRIELANVTAQGYLPALNDARVGDILEHFGDIPLSEALAQSSGATWSEVVLHNPLRVFEVAARELQVSGESGGWVLVLKDVTEERRRLQQTQEQDRLASVGQLAAGIAHDFNNILTPLLLSADMGLMEVGQESRLGRNLVEIKRATARAKNLIAHILAFSRQGPHEEPKAIRLQPIVEEVMELVRAGLPATIDIRTESDPDAGAVLADPTEMHQVLMNLCVNAQHAMQKTGGELAVTLTTVDIGDDAGVEYPNLEAGTYVRLSVCDTGHGMDEAVLAHIFEPFFTTKGPGEGSGMGLAVIHGIIGSYGGKITVESEIGKGTTFHIDFRQVADTPEATVALSVPRIQGIGDILIVDDETAIVAILQESLVHLGYRVAGETESEAALARFREQPARFDLVITDMTMPRMTGEVLAQELLRIRPDVPVVLTTGYNEHITTAEMNDIGIRAVLKKPFSSDELGQILSQIFEAERQNREVE